jgi:hypothetical protein
MRQERLAKIQAVYDRGFAACPWPIRWYQMVGMLLDEVEHLQLALEFWKRECAGTGRVKP